jgi:hypothetical protein
LGKERKFVWRVRGNFTEEFLQEQQEEKRGQELGSWSKNAGQILEYVGEFLELEIEEPSCQA